MKRYTKVTGIYGTSITYKRQSLAYSPGDLLAVKPYDFHSYETDEKSLGYRVPYNLVPDNLERTILTNALASQLQEQIQDQNLWETILESRKTIDLAVGYAVDALRLAKGLKRNTVRWVKKYGIGIKVRSRRKRRKRPDLSNIPSEWLRFNFGVMPLIYTTDGLLNTLNMPLAARRMKCRTHLVANHRWRDPNYGWDYSSYVDVDFQMSQTGFVRPKNPNSGFIAQQGLSDLVGAAWAVMPWSWAIDYFTNVGGALQRFNPAYRGLEFLRWSNFLVCTTSYIKKEYRSSTKSEFTSGTSVSGWRKLGYHLYQSLLPGVSLSVRRLSYLMSAIAVTLKGKFS